MVARVRGRLLTNLSLESIADASSKKTTSGRRLMTAREKSEPSRHRRQPRPSRIGRISVDEQRWD